MTRDELKKLESTLWDSADTLRANSDLKSSEYSTPVLGIIFLRFVDNIYCAHEAVIEAEYAKLKGTRRERPLHEIALEKCGFYLPKEARYDHLLNLPEKEDIAKALKKAMQRIEEFKPELKDTLPQDEYFRLVRKPEYRIIPKKLLKNFADIPRSTSGDLFGQIYEYFLEKFALAEGQGGGEFFTPRSVVRLMVEILEPHQGKGTVYDPACGSGGMFVQSSKFVEARKSKQGDSSLFVYGQEKTLETVKLAKMNLAVNGLRGDIRQANSYFEDPHGSFGKFDYVMANPPFNVDDVNLAKVEGDRRFNTYGIPRNKTKLKSKQKGAETVPNANYLWINLFATSLKPKGRAALVMANSASDARHSEADIRRTLIEQNLIYAMLTLPSNMFYTVTLPATLWFFDKGKQNDRILFIDARNVFTQIDRAHREFTEEQVKNLALISRLHRGNRRAFTDQVHRYFTEGFARMGEHRPKLTQVADKVVTFLKANDAPSPPDFRQAFKIGATLEKSFQAYLGEVDPVEVDSANKKQRKLFATLQPFFTALHEVLKEADKQVRLLEKGVRGGRDLKALKQDLEALHKEARETEYLFSHIGWLQERFPKAEYDDVTGLCKLASRKDVEEQEYSLNPGRYVGVVIEEDGKTEEVFNEELLGICEDLSRLNSEARQLEGLVEINTRKLVDGL